MYIRFLGTQNPSILLSLASHSIVLYCLILCHFDLCLFMSFSIVMIVVMDRTSWSVLVLFLVKAQASSSPADWDHLLQDLESSWNLLAVKHWLTSVCESPGIIGIIFIYTCLYFSHILSHLFTFCHNCQKKYSLSYGVWSWTLSSQLLKDYWRIHETYVGKNKQT